MKRLLIFLALIGLTAAPTQAAIINPHFLTPGLNQIDDTDFERLIGDADTIIEVGETLEAIGLISTLNGTPLGFPPISLPGANYNLTFHSKITVTSFVDDNDTNGNGVQDGAELPFLGVGDFVFGNGFDLDADGTNETSILVYEDGDGTAGSVSTLFTSTAGVGTDISNATDGTLILSLGLVGIGLADGDFWEAFSAPQDIGLFKAPPPNDSGGTFFAGLSVLSNPGGLPIFTELAGGGITTNAGFNRPTTTHDIVLNGTLIDPSATTSSGWDAQTNTLIQFQGTPEPTSFVVWSVMVLGCALAALRRRKR